jgi:hypothetical protein
MIPITSMTYTVIKKHYIDCFGEDAWETHWLNHSDDDAMLAQAVDAIVQFGIQGYKCPTTA